MLIFDTEYWYFIAPARPSSLFAASNGKDPQFSKMKESEAGP
jgi:hypothetical protein